MKEVRIESWYLNAVVKTLISCLRSWNNKQYIELINTLDELVPMY
jgi:hypothetical protein